MPMLILNHISCKICANNNSDIFKKKLDLNECYNELPTTLKLQGLLLHRHMPIISTDIQSITKSP